jgi:predicted AlkP superfamily phosphohydrolase/phosphomutase
MMCLHAYSEMLHAFWRFYDPRHPRYRPYGEVFGGRDPFQELLETLDGVVGEVLDWTGPRGLVLVIGAWGHWLEHTRVHVNRILEREGLLRFKRSPRTTVKRLMFGLGISAAGVERLAHRLNLYKLFHYKLSRGKRAAVTGATFLSFDDIDWPRTQAVATGYLGQVFVNVRGRRPAGTVDPADYETVRERLRDLFDALRDPRTGEPMVERVWKREEIYSGARLDDAPDLVVEFREGYSGQASIGASRGVVAPSPPHHSSEHCKESLVLALGEGVRPGEIEARLQDVAPTVLHALGVPAPPDYEGRVLPIFGS